MRHLIPSQKLPSLIAAEQIIPVTRAIIEEFRAVRQQVSENVTLETACFANVIQPLIDVENRTQGRCSMIGMLRYASPQQAAREASDRAMQLLAECQSEFTAREDLYILAKAVVDKAEALELEAAKYLECIYLDFKRCGHGVLDCGQIEPYLETRNKIDSLRRKYNRIIQEEKGGLIFSLEELDGVPENMAAQFPEGTGPGTKFVPFRKTSVDIILKYARNPATRRRMYVHDAHKLQDNLKLFENIILLRDTNARLLGYDSHAAFRLEKRMAKDPAWVNNLLDNLSATLIPQGREEIRGLLARKQAYLAQNTDYPQDDIDSMPPWDFPFFTRLLLEDFELDHAKVAEYFPLRRVLDGLLGLFSSCLQLKFVPIPAEELIELLWHEDVTAWSVWDQRETNLDEFVGYLYADVLWRPNKYKGAQNVNLQCGYGKEDGTRVYPATVLMCSFPKPTGPTGTTLEHASIVTLFHEIGHGIHDLVSRTSTVRFHGHRAPPDFAEAPSVMLENWAWMKAELKKISCHYTKMDQQSGDTIEGDSQIPDSLLEKLLESRNVNRALWYLRQLAFARFDMTVHNAPSHDELVKLDPTTIFNNLMEQLCLQPVPDQDDRGHHHADFGHLMSGYDAGYYSYLSAHVIAAELFEAVFVENPRSQTAWERYRRCILEPGGSRDELTMLKEFLGHSPGIRGFTQRLVVG